MSGSDSESSVEIERIFVRPKKKKSAALPQMEGSSKPKTVKVKPPEKDPEDQPVPQDCEAEKVKKTQKGKGRKKKEKKPRKIGPYTQALKNLGYFQKGTYKKLPTKGTPEHAAALAEAEKIRASLNAGPEEGED